MLGASLRIITTTTLMQISENEMRECLERSGYLLESQVVRGLSTRGFFVEPNQVIRDSKSGKSREIDVVAEYYNYVPEHDRICVKTTFVAEIVNNRYPLILLTPRPVTPNTNIDDHVKFGYTPEPCPFIQHLDIYEDRSPEANNLFSQYCGLSPKKGEKREFMASHSEDLFASLQKVSEYVEEELASFAEWTKRSKGDYWRVFFWHPCLVVGGELYTVRPLENEEPVICATEHAFLEFNWHFGEERRTTAIEVITARALYARIETIVESDISLQERLDQIRKQSQ
jgi:hypothetical protein